MNRATVADLLVHLESEVPSAWAEPWDRVGLLVGDPGRALRRVFVSLDPTPHSLAAAKAAGADVLLTHHPAFLEAPSTLTSADGMRGLPLAAAAAGIALVAAHTNLDRSSAGAEALPKALGLTALEPLESSRESMSLVVTYAPASATPGLLSAVAAAGAGRIGRYDECSFTTAGTGRYVPRAGAEPTVGRVGEHVESAEDRIEVVCAPEVLDAVLGVLRTAHPYEEPVVLVTACERPRGAARMGRVCAAPAAATAGSLAELVGRALGVRPRVWGDATTPVRLIGVAPGSGRSLVGDAMRHGCDAFVTGELRYHEALDAASSGLTIIEAGHDATEWPLTRALAAIAAGTPGLGESCVLLDQPGRTWWTAEGA